MPSEPDLRALQRFARDLRRIREDRDVSLAAVHAATQVPKSQLQSFEAGTLYDKSSLTPVYLRGFVRAYAEAVGISPDSALTHLDSALSGKYEDELAVQYLDVPPSVDESSPSSGSPISSGEEDAGDSEERSSEVEDEEFGERAASAGPGYDSSKGESGRSSREEEASRSSSRASPETSERSDAPGLSSSPQTTSSQARSFFGVWGDLWMKQRSRLLVAAIILVLFALAGILVTTYLGGNSASDSPSDLPEAASLERSAPDSVDAAGPSEAEAPSQPPPRADVTLGDTLYVTVLATSDVRGMRVRQDDDLRRPYWIREGRAKVFPFTRKITIQNQLDSLRLLLEGYAYPESRTDEEGRIVITRDTTQQFFENLRATPSTVSVSPDTVWGGPPTSRAAPLPHFSLLVVRRGSCPALAPV